MSRLLNGCTVVFLQLYTLSAYSGDWETKMPEFTNSWTLKNDIGYYYAGCRGKQFTYQNQNSSAESLALNASYNGSSRERPSNCSWKIINVTQASGWQPETFPGTYSEWRIIEKTISIKRPVQKLFTRVCLDEGGQEKGRDEIIVFPIYECPEGSETRRGHWDRPDGCYLNRELCTGDVVARELDSTILWYTGHIGIVTGTNSEITEVLNSDEYPHYFGDSSKVIQQNSFGSFAFNTNTPFWGAVYNAPKSGYLDYSDEVNIQSAAYDQYNSGFYTARYTILPIAKPYEEKKYYFYDEFYDKFREGYASSSPRFRCDTFVKYVYDKAVNDGLVTTNKLLTPRQVFNAFLSKRQSYPENISGWINPTATDDLNYLKSASCDTIECYMSEIEALINKNEDINTIYRYFKKIKEITHQHRVLQDTKAQINFYDLLYKLRAKFPFRIDVYKITLDIMSEDSPFLYLPWLIHDYKKIQADNSNFSKKAKLHILSIFHNSLLLDEDQIKKISKTDKKTIIDLQKLIKSVLQNTESKQEGMQAIFIAPIVLGYYDSILYTYEVRDRLHLYNDKETQSQLEFFDIKQSIYASLLGDNKFIELKQKFGAKKFHNVLLMFIRNINVKNLKTNNRTALKNYLKTIEPKNQTSLKSEYMSYERYSKNYIEWFDAYAHLFSMDSNTKNIFYLKKIMSLNDTNLSSFLFLSRHPDMYRDINKSLLQNYLHYLKEQTNNMARANNNGFINSAITNINTLLRQQNSPGV